MSTTQVRARHETMAEVVNRLGDIPLERIIADPPIGSAVEQDVLDLDDHEDRICELVDGVLVEKPMGFMASRLAVVLISALESHLQQNGLGIVAGEAGMMKLAPGLVRIPDVSVVLWGRLPGCRLPTDPIPDLAPDIAVQVLSESNTAAEMRRKIGEYFEAGTQSVWLVDPPTPSVRVFSSPTDSLLLTGDDLVTAERIIPGFQIPVSEIFRRAGV